MIFVIIIPRISQNIFQKILLGVIRKNPSEIIPRIPRKTPLWHFFKLLTIPLRISSNIPTKNCSKALFKNSLLPSFSWHRAYSNTKYLLPSSSYGSLISKHCNALTTLVLSSEQVTHDPLSSVSWATHLLIPQQLSQGRPGRPWVHNLSELIYHDNPSNEPRGALGPWSCQIHKGASFIKHLQTYMKLRWNLLESPLEPPGILSVLFEMRWKSYWTSAHETPNRGEGAFNKVSDRF